MLLEMNGIPAGKLKSATDPRLRLALTEKYADASMSASKKLELEYKRVNIIAQNERFKQSEARKERIATETSAMNAWRRDIGERKMAKEELTTFIKEGQNRVNSLQTDLKLKQNKLLELRKGNVFIDSSGLMMDEEARAKEVPLLQQEVNNLESEIRLEEDKLKSYTAKLKPGAKEGATTTTEEPKKATPTSFVFTPKATADIKAQYKEFMDREKDMDKRKAAEKYAIDQGWITGK
jgi:hypothetical protein